MAGGDDGLGDGARAVGDGQGGGLSDGVGLVAVGDLSGLRAVGDVGGDDLSDDGHVAVGVGRDAGNGKSGDGGELHLDGIRWVWIKLEELGIRYRRGGLTKVID